MNRLICPACQAPLVNETLEGEPAFQIAAGPFRSNARMTRLEAASATILVDRCHACHGIWFDRGEMSEAIQRLDVVDVPTTGFLPPFRSEPRRCPGCQERLKLVKSAAAPSVTFMRCKTCCGSWFDQETHVALLALLTRQF